LGFARSRIHNRTPACACRHDPLYGRVGPPATDSDLRVVERTIGAVPEPLREFFIHGTAALDCAYIFEPKGGALERLRMVLPTETRIFGGARLGPVSELGDYSRAVREWATDTWIAEAEDQRAIWETAVPFLRLDNGDYLALDPRANANDPAVAYLCHDDESSCSRRTCRTF
jgi:SMI1 / KNR4 family (SUKH-1)